MEALMQSAATKSLEEPAAMNTRTEHEGADVGDEDEDEDEDEG